MEKHLFSKIVLSALMVCLITACDDHHTSGPEPLPTSEVSTAGYSSASNNGNGDTMDQKRILWTAAIAGRDGKSVSVETPEGDKFILDDVDPGPYKSLPEYVQVTFSGVLDKPGFFGGLDWHIKKVKIYHTENAAATATRIAEQNVQFEKACLKQSYWDDQLPDVKLFEIKRMGPMEANVEYHMVTAPHIQDLGEMADRMERMTQGGSAANVLNKLCYIDTYGGHMSIGVSTDIGDGSGWKLSPNTIDLPLSQFIVASTDPFPAAPVPSAAAGMVASTAVVSAGPDAQSAAAAASDAAAAAQDAAAAASDVVADLPDAASEGPADGTQSAGGNVSYAPASTAVVEPDANLLKAGKCANATDCAKAMLASAKTEDLPAALAAANTIDSLQKPPHGNKALARKLNQQGLDALNGSNPHEAVKLLEQANQTDPADVEIVSNLSYAYAMDGQLAKSEDTAVLALALNPRRTSVWAPLAETIAKEHRTGQAVEAMWLAYQFSGDKQKTLGFIDSKLGTEKDPDALKMYALSKAWFEQNTKPGVLQ